MSQLRRTLAITGGVLLTALLPLTSARAQKPPAGGAPSQAVKADKDGDKVFDDLERDLEAAPEGERVRVMVALAEPATERRLRGLERRVGNMAVGHRFDIVRAFSATVTMGQARALSRQPEVLHVEADSHVHATNDSAQTAFGVTAARAVVPGLDGSGVKVAVIDTGVAASHVDLAGKVTAFRDYVGGRSTAYDDHGHGTHVAATIAGHGAANPAHAGVAPAASLMAAKVLDANGDGDLSDTAAAIDWAVSQEAQVINLSLGATGCADGSDITAQAVDNAAARGVLVAVAAGNEGPGTCTVGSPGAAPGATTVAAMADVGQGGFGLADFSSRGRPGTTGAAVKPDVSAPGVGIVSASAFNSTGYTAMSGTSMATPFVAGVAALMLEKGIAPVDVKPVLKSTAVDWGVPGADLEFGAGRLDAYRALTAAADPTPRPAHAFRQAGLAGTGAQIDYQVTVDDARFPVAATLVHPSIAAAGAATPDFDLYLFDPSGTEVARAYTASRQETLSVRPTAAGTYTLRVRSYDGAGTYQLDVSVGGAVSVPATRTSTLLAPTTVSPTGDLTTLDTDDNRYYTQLSAPTGRARRTSFTVAFSGVPADVTGLTVIYTGKNSLACTQSVAIERRGAWEQIFNGSVGLTEVTVARAPAGPASGYVAADGTVRAQVQCASGGNFMTSADVVALRYERTA